MSIFINIFSLRKFPTFWNGRSRGAEEEIFFPHSSAFLIFLPFSSRFSWFNCVILTLFRARYFGFVCNSFPKKKKKRPQHFSPFQWKFLALFMVSGWVFFSQKSFLSQFTVFIYLSYLLFLLSLPLYLFVFCSIFLFFCFFGTFCDTTTESHPGVVI